MTQGMVISKGMIERAMDNRGSKSVDFTLGKVVSTVKEQRADASSESVRAL